MNDPSDTKARILDAAEAVFAERGYDAASMRAITGAAGANLAAVHYHFGSKERLHRAVIERRVHAINAERIRRLDELEAAHPDGVPVEALLEAFLAPALERSARDDEGWARFRRVIGRVLSGGEGDPTLFREVFGEVIERFLGAAATSLPHLGRAEVFWRFSFLLGSFFIVLTDGGRLRTMSAGACDARDTDEALRQLLAFAAGGFRSTSGDGGGSGAQPARRRA